MRRIAADLTTLYDLDALDVAPFLCDVETARAAVGDEVHRGEVLMVAEEEDGVSVGLYVEQRALDALANEAHGTPARERAWELAAEGVSHLVYLDFRARNDERVSVLELELQAEVDKWAVRLLGAGDASLLSGWGAPLVQARSRAIRRRLFTEASFLDPQGSPEGERYRLASRAAARYTARLEATFLEGRSQGLVSALRRFYRLGPHDKLREART